MCYLVEIIHVGFSEVISEGQVVAELREHSLQFRDFLRWFKWSASSDLQFHRVALSSMDDSSSNNSSCSKLRSEKCFNSSNTYTCIHRTLTEATFP